MRVTRVAATIFAAATLTSLVGVGGAHAAPAAPNEAHLVGVVTYDPGDPHVGYVQARYRCDYATPHLWVSVKQNDARTADPALAEEGSGGLGAASTWLDSHRNPVTCDGKWHTEVFTVDQVEPNWNGGGVKPGALAKGDAWVQFCLTSGDEGDGYSDMQFRKVRTA
jgi:hypothetical protein